MYHLNIDVHKDDSHVAVLDDDGEVVEEARVHNQVFGTSDCVQETGV